MNPQKIGCYLKELRNGKALTQEQLAEQLNVSRRTVSRWETGSNLPDLSILIELADYYGVDLRDLLDGERKGEEMNKELEETVRKAADYSNEEKQKLIKRMHVLFVTGLLAFIIYIVMLFLGLAGKSFLHEAVSSFSLGLSFGMMVTGVIITSRYALKIRAFKVRLWKREKAQ